MSPEVQDEREGERLLALMRYMQPGDVAIEGLHGEYYVLHADGVLTAPCEVGEA